jgi:hypothetical protein
MGNEDHGRPQTIVETPPTGTEITHDSRQVGQFWQKRRDSTATERYLVDNVFSSFSSTLMACGRLDLKYFKERIPI